MSTSAGYQEDMKEAELTVTLYIHTSHTKKGFFLIKAFFIKICTIKVILPSLTIVTCSRENHFFMCAHTFVGMHP